MTTMPTTILKVTFLPNRRTKQIKDERKSHIYMLAPRYEPCSFELQSIRFKIIHVFYYVTIRIGSIYCATRIHSFACKNRTNFRRTSYNLRTFKIIINLKTIFYYFTLYTNLTLRIICLSHDIN